MNDFALSIALPNSRLKRLLPITLLAAFLLAGAQACTKKVSVDDLGGQQNTVMTKTDRQIVGLALEKELRGQSVYSPKSAIFSLDGQKFYVNALEGCETLVYDANTMVLRKTVRHKFDENNAGLFLNGETSLFDYTYNSDTAGGKRNCFSGKPVESAFSHNGRYLWVTYYRRSWDKNASSPSAVAIIDTRKDETVRVMPTGPLPKMIVPSPDGKKMAVIHWGDNTVGLVDIASGNPADFRWQTLLVSGNKLKVAGISSNRDSQCGQCLRGAAFTSDSRYLFVARMGGGGLTAFDLADGPNHGRNLGTLSSIAPTPRHLVMGPDGKKLYATSNISGIVTELDVDKLLTALQRANGGTTNAYRGREIKVGNGARTLAVSAGGRYLFVACNNNSSLVVVDAKEWKIVCSEKVPPYAVGLAISPDGSKVVTTSQGRGGVGGHVVAVFRVLTRKLGL